MPPIRTHPSGFSAKFTLQPHPPALAVDNDRFDKRHAWNQSDLWSLECDSDTEFRWKISHLVNKHLVDRLPANRRRDIF